MIRIVARTTVVDADYLPPNTRKDRHYFYPLTNLFRALTRCVRNFSRSAMTWILFRYWYVSSLAQKERVGLLKIAIRETFNDPWVADVDIQLRSRSGENVIAGRDVFWDAPVAVAVFRKTTKRRHVAFCMSCYLAGDVVSVRQLQGVFAVDIPPSLRLWPQLFVQSCVTFAVKNNLRRVRVAKASSLYAYHHATVRGETPADIDKARAGIQQRMLSHYDGSAKKLGFADAGEWYVWDNPNYKP